MALGRGLLDASSLQLHKAHDWQKNATPTPWQLKAPIPSLRDSSIEAAIVLPGCLSWVCSPVMCFAWQTVGKPNKLHSNAATRLCYIAVCLLFDLFLVFVDSSFVAFCFIFGIKTVRPKNLPPFIYNPFSNQKCTKMLCK